MTSVRFRLLMSALLMIAAMIARGHADAVMGLFLLAASGAFCGSACAEQLGESLNFKAKK